MKIKPLHSNVLIELSKQEMKVGSLFVPQGAHQDKLVKATVIAVGPGLWSEKTGEREAIDLKPGDVVLVDHAIYNIEHFPAWRLRDYENTKDGVAYHIIPYSAVKALDSEATEASTAAAE